jgi:hypothetical protein
MAPITSFAPTNSIASRIHVNTKKLRNITCTLVAKGVILRSLECIFVLLMQFFVNKVLNVL